MNPLSGQKRIVPTDNPIMAQLCCAMQTAAGPQGPDDGPRLYGAIRERWVPLLNGVRKELRGGAGGRLRGAAALPLRALHARAAAARAGCPRAPGAPAAVDRVGTVTHRHALAVEAPLQRDRPEEEKTRFKDAVVDVEPGSLAAGSTEAQRPYRLVKTHASSHGGAWGWAGLRHSLAHL